MTASQRIERTAQSLFRWVRREAQNLVDREWFEPAVLSVIGVNALTLGLETSDLVRTHAGEFLDIIDTLLIGIFLFELAVRAFAGGKEYFGSWWGRFDVAVVIGSAVAESFSVLRAVRSLRLLKTVGLLKSMKQVVDGLVAALPNLLAVIPLLALFLYVWAVMGTTQFGRSLPDEFGDLGKSLYTLFQTATLENWATTASKLMGVAPVGAWLYLLPFMLITAFAVFNLFIAVMVDAMQRHLVHEVEEVEESIEAEQQTEQAMLQSLGVLTDEVQGLKENFAQLDRRASTIGKRAGMVATTAITALVLWRARESMVTPRKFRRG